MLPYNIQHFPGDEGVVVVALACQMLEMATTTIPAEETNKQTNGEKKNSNGNDFQ